MVSESLQELLSAYVDGELTPAEYERVMAALRDSAVAREYVQQLRELSGRIKRLPKFAVPTSFSAHYLKHDRKVRRRRTAWRWGAVGAAAAALVAGVSMWMNWPQPAHVPGPGPIEIAKNNTPPVVPNQPNPMPAPELVRPDVTWMANLGRRAAAWSVGQLDRLGTGVDATLGLLANAADAAARNERDQKNLFASRVKEPGNPFGTTDIELPPLITPDKFNLADFQKQWGKKGLFQADLACADTVKTLTRLNEACQRHGLHLVIDEEVQKRLEKRLPATFMLYLENVPDETLEKVWMTLQELDHWRDGLTATDASCQSIHFTSPDNDARKQLARSMGMSAEKLVTPKASTTPAPAQAVVMGYHANRLPENISPHVRQAINGQSGPKADTVSVLFFLRSAK